MGSTLEEDGELDAEVPLSVQNGWKNGRESVESWVTENEREERGSCT